jgi:hypothetical protein
MLAGASRHALYGRCTEEAAAWAIAWQRPQAVALRNAGIHSVRGPLEALLTAQLRLSKAEADATCEHQPNRAGEAVLPGLNLGAGICFETQFRISYVLRE